MCVEMEQRVRIPAYSKTKFQILRCCQVLCPFCAHVSRMAHPPLKKVFSTDEKLNIRQIVKH